MQNWTALTLWLVVAEAIAIATALIIASYVKETPKHVDADSAKTVSLTTQLFLDNLKCSTKGLAEEESVMWCRALLLCSRLLVIGILIVHLKGWAGLLVLSHFLLSSIWIAFSEKKSEDSEFVSRVLQISYVLFWDVTSTLLGRISLWTWALPVLLVTGENGALILLHWYTVPGELLVTITSGTCLLFGTLLFSALNLLSLTHLAELLGLESEVKAPPPQHTAVPVFLNPNLKGDCDKAAEALRPAVVQTSSTLSLSEIPRLINGSSSWGFTGQPLEKPQLNNYTSISETLKTRGGEMGRTDSGEKVRLIF